MPLHPPHQPLRAVEKRRDEQEGQAKPHGIGRQHPDVLAAMTPRLGAADDDRGDIRNQAEQAAVLRRQDRDDTGRLEHRKIEV